MCALASELDVAPGTNGNASSLLGVFSDPRGMSFDTDGRVFMSDFGPDLLSKDMTTSVADVGRDMGAISLAVVSGATPDRLGCVLSWLMTRGALLRRTALVLISLVAVRLHPDQILPKDPREDGIHVCATLFAMKTIVRSCWRKAEVNRSKVDLPKEIGSKPPKRLIINTPPKRTLFFSLPQPSYTCAPPLPPPP